MFVCHFSSVIFPSFFTCHLTAVQNMTFFRDVRITLVVGCSLTSGDMRCPSTHQKCFLFLSYCESATTIKREQRNHVIPLTKICPYFYDQNKVFAVKSSLAGSAATLLLMPRRFRCTDIYFLLLGILCFDSVSVLQCTIL